LLPLFVQFDEGEQMFVVQVATHTRYSGTKKIAALYVGAPLLYEIGRAHV
jgi:hypothetical protein